jgi:hypothetical protein
MDLDLGLVFLVEESAPDCRLLPIAAAVVPRSPDALAEPWTREDLAYAG